jgi:hypothetical protein
MRRKHCWIGGIGILALLAVLPVISSGAPSANKGSKAPAATEKLLYSFTGGTDGANPMSGLVLDSAGNLYGTTSNGGTVRLCGGGGCGTVFELKRLGTVFKLAPNGKGGWTESTLYSFGAGANPASDLVFDTNGNMYGTTLSGGIASCFLGTGCGTVFELIKQSDGSWTGSTIYEFTGPPNDGEIPSSGVTIDSSGNLYGTTVAGGSGQCDLAYNPGCGVAYKLTPDGKGNWTETVLFNFARGNGFAVIPSSGLLVDQAGDRLVGTTLHGGDGVGTVFVLKQSKDLLWKQDVLHRFYESQDGFYPVGQLTKDGNGNLFGVTWAGGGVTNQGFGNGMVFELEPSTMGVWKETIVYAFAGGTDAWDPQAGVALDNLGHLYGTTLRGGTGTLCSQAVYGCGTVYEITP